MNERVDIPEQSKAEPEQGVGGASLGASSLVRRDLFRKGAVVVGVTLSSRPVLAWHCKTTSAWGSELLNPATSLKNNTTAHALFADEGWYVKDWAGNVSRALGTPWAYLASKYPAIVNSKTKTGTTFDYKKVTVGMLATYLGVQTPTGVSSGNLAYVVLGYGNLDFRASTLAAQLNFIVLNPNPDPYSQEKCVNLAQLKQMATATFTPSVGGSPWTKAQIVTYLSNNWLAP